MSTESYELPYNM